jgi:hypothetical protein
MKYIIMLFITLFAVVPHAHTSTRPSETGAGTLEEGYIQASKTRLAFLEKDPVANKKEIDKIRAFIKMREQKQKESAG